MSGLSRRALLAGLGGLAATQLAAQPRPRVARAASPQSLADIQAQSGLADLSGFVLVDLGSGAVLEAHRADQAFPPASVAKILTALYARAALGADYRFETRLIGAGSISGSVLGGDLALVGSGDPLLDTDALGAMAGQLADAGVKSVAGGFGIVDDALPAIAMIDPAQPAAAAYNPTISGLNVNFNRVFLSWVPGQAGPVFDFTAPGARFTVPAPGFTAKPRSDLRAPEHVGAGAGETWLMPSAGVKGRGSIWLPVRAPRPYASEVFLGLAAQRGVRLSAASAGAQPQGRVLARHEGDRLDTLLRGMLYHSTNLTAEVVGLRASQRRGVAPTDLGASAAAMNAWAAETLGVTGAVFVNHSGLSDASHLSARQQVGMLAAADGVLPGLLRERGIADGSGGTLEARGARVLSKTGTLDFVSALAGYIDRPDGSRLGFAIFAADGVKRAAIRPEDRSAPPGAKAWSARARGQQQALLRRWVALYAA